MISLPKIAEMFKHLQNTVYKYCQRVQNLIKENLYERGGFSHQFIETVQRPEYIHIFLILSLKLLYYFA